MSHVEVLIVGLLVAVAGLGTLARLLSVPYAVVLVVGGGVLGFIPGLPQIELDPDVVLVVFLPPLLYGSGVFANVGDFRAAQRWLALNAVPLLRRRAQRSSCSRSSPLNSNRAFGRPSSAMAHPTNLTSELLCQETSPGEDLGLSAA